MTTPRDTPADLIKAAAEADRRARLAQAMGWA